MPRAARSTRTLGNWRTSVLDRTKHPVGWAQFVDELNDAHEHLGNLIQEMRDDPEYDDANLRVDLGHVLAHLYRAWNCRDIPDSMTDEQWEAARTVPVDLEPIA